MVATYVEIVYGIRLTDKEACTIFFNMSDEEYTDRLSKVGVGVFVDCDFVRNYTLDLVNLQKMLRCDINIFTCICCSNTTDIVVGVSLRKLYRINRRCEQCSKYNLCKRCFSSTEMCEIDYDSTYEFGECLKDKVCGMCYSYNTYNNDICHVCSFEMTPYTDKNAVLEKKINKILGTDKQAKLYFHWNDCCSCT